MFADKIDVVFQALHAKPAREPGRTAHAHVSAFSPPGMMWLGAMLLLLGTVGVLVTARIALAVLLALGPVFVVMALFQGTRGLFAGWLKGVVMLGDGAAVRGARRQRDARAGGAGARRAGADRRDRSIRRRRWRSSSIGAVHMALMVMVLKVAGTMVAGWRVFGLVPDDAAIAPTTGPPHASAVAAPSPAGRLSRASRLQEAARTPVAPRAEVRMPAQLGGHGAEARVRATARMVTSATASGASWRSDRSGASRARGIGSRFRPPRRCFGEM